MFSFKTRRVLLPIKRILSCFDFIKFLMFRLKLVIERILQILINLSWSHLVFNHFHSCGKNWKQNIPLTSKIKLMHAFIISICLYPCKLWTLTANPQRHIEALEMKCYNKILNISYWDHIRNEKFRKRITADFGLHNSQWRKKNDVVQSSDKIIRLGKKHPERHTTDWKMKRQTKKHVWRWHLGMDRPVLC